MGTGAARWVVGCWWLVLLGGCPPAPPEVVVSVSASDPQGLPLSYRWRTTDGTLTSATGPSATWRLPAGPGLHFAYVLVSNGHGGLVERRVAVSTDDLGVPAAPASPASLAPPPAPAAAGVPYRSVLRSRAYYPSPNQRPNDDGVYVPGGVVQLRNRLTDAGTALAVSDARGSFVIPQVLPGEYDAFCAPDPATPLQPCFFGSVIPVQDQAVHDPLGGPQGFRTAHRGRAVLASGGACGAVNEFFGVDVQGTVTLLADGGTALLGPQRQDAWGHWSLDTRPGAVAIRLECEGAAPVELPLPAPTASPRTVFADAAPVVASMAATLDGKQVGLFLPPPTGKPSDQVEDPEFFLSFKGIDSRLSACRYYQAVGAVRACDDAGVATGAVTFEDWKRTTGLAPFGDGGTGEVSATYINRVDLGLTRRHHSISSGPGRVAAYVCNHLGPRDDSQAAIDSAIDDAVRGRNLVACVGMDHDVAAGVNGGRPFTRFLIFGPSGELLPSVNLDGRREKFVPGVCVACHGGDRYAGRYPTSGPTPADIGAHFLPYDTGNFVFSSDAGLREVDQQAALKVLNLNVLQSDATPATRELVAGWYADGGLALDKGYLPPSWVGGSSVSRDFYLEVYARSCRTCHVAFAEALNFDHRGNFQQVTQPIDEDGALRMAISVCAGTSSSFVRNFSMPNSLTTFNLFWGSADSGVDQPALTAAFLAELGASGVDVQRCGLYASPIP